MTHLGRGAAWLAFHALGLGPGSRVAMPAYHCGSEVEAARLAGVEVVFYRITPSLEVDEEDLARVTTSVDAVYLISNFGFPMPDRPAGVPVIADAAHALFSCDAAGVPLGRGAEAMVFCPRKSLGVPDGGALLTARAVPTPTGRAPAKRILRSAASLAIGRAAEARVAPVRALAAAVLRRASKADAAAERGDLTEVVIGEWDLSVDDMRTAASRPSRVTALVAPRAHGPAIRERRRANYERLTADLGDRCPAAYRRLPPGVCPLYLPVVAADRDRTMRELLTRGVRAIEVWPVPHPLLDRVRFADLEPMRRGLLALPVHQHLDDRAIDKVRDAAVAALR